MAQRRTWSDGRSSFEVTGGRSPAPSLRPRHPTPQGDAARTPRTKGGPLRSLVPLLLLPLVISDQQLPEPVGHVNDFADAISPEAEADILRVIDEVRQKSGGEIVVVTLRSLEGRPRDEVALELGASGEWGSAASRALTGDVLAPLQERRRQDDGFVSLLVWIVVFLVLMSLLGRRGRRRGPRGCIPIILPFPGGRGGRGGGFGGGGIGRSWW